MAGYQAVRQFRRLMHQSVLVAAASTYGQDGARSYGSDVQYQCAVIGEGKLTLGANGQQVVSRQSVYLMSNAAIRPEDRITLSTGDVGSTESYAIQPPILAVERYPFTQGQYCTVLRL